MLKKVSLIGKRMKLLPLQASHAEGLYKAAAFPEVWTYLSTKVKNQEDMHHIINNALEAREKGTELPFTVIDQETDAIVGSTRFLYISIPNKHLEIGWTWYTPAVWRTRVNTESKYLLLRYCFETLQFNRVQFKTDARNKRSRQAIIRLGAVEEGIIRKERVLQDGYIRDSAMYSIIKEEWPSVKERLECFLQEYSYQQVYLET
ncbi:GNAT family N-acetyltransferase [Bacillus chungangensis]|uniref:RimJ/RimL family protein N-acetyltransferase n=1 Tax=Bacillus chungangensis TaxID=587633 RepID=A0ABT9WZ53_9BACI|nr:GNAT family N-acetyltransferase [Bacillus chungangensis]MDQ0178584.1 RimJ/RimL family protein N-acetyltransferase [Bacillus chungangensis]